MFLVVRTLVRPRRRLEAIRWSMLSARAHLVFSVMPFFQIVFVLCVYTQNHLLVKSQVFVC